MKAGPQSCDPSNPCQVAPLAPHLGLRGRSRSSPAGSGPSRRKHPAQMVAHVRTRRRRRRRRRDRQLTVILRCVGQARHPGPRFERPLVRSPEPEQGRCPSWRSGPGSRSRPAASTPRRSRRPGQTGVPAAGTEESSPATVNATPPQWTAVALRPKSTSDKRSGGGWKRRRPWTIPKAGPAGAPMSREGMGGRRLPGQRNARKVSQCAAMALGPDLARRRRGSPLSRIRGGRRRRLHGCGGSVGTSSGGDMAGSRERTTEASRRATAERPPARDQANDAGGSPPASSAEGGVDASYGAAQWLPLPAADLGPAMQLSMTPFSVAPGAEVDMCQVFANPFGSTDTDLLEITATIGGGSDRAVLFALVPTEASVEPPIGTVGDCAGHGLEFHPVLMLSQQPQQTTRYPTASDGSPMGYRLAGSKVLMLYTHYLNLGSSAVAGDGDVDRHAGQGRCRHDARRQHAAVSSTFLGPGVHAEDQSLRHLGDDERRLVATRDLLDHQLAGLSRSLWPATHGEHRGPGLLQAVGVGAAGRFPARGGGAGAVHLDGSGESPSPSPRRAHSPGTAPSSTPARYASPRATERSRMPGACTSRSTIPPTRRTPTGSS